MSDTLHEITRYAMRSSEPYARWADEVSRLKIETAERQERILDLEDILRAIVEYNERGYGAEYIRAIEDAKALLS